MSDPAWEPDKIPWADLDQEFVESRDLLWRILGQQADLFIRRRMAGRGLANEALARAMQEQFRKTIDGLYLPHAAGLDEPAATCTDDTAVEWLSDDDMQPASDLLSAIASMKETAGLRPQRGTARVIKDANITIAEKRTRKRSWRERLLSMPWRPLRATEAEWVNVPDPNVYLIDSSSVPHVAGYAPPAGRVLVGHPATIRRVMDQLVADEVELGPLSP